MIARAVILLSLALDTFAVALGLGLARLPRRRWPRVGLTFTLFEGLMPLAGLLLGRSAGSVLGGAAEVVAALILVGFGGYTVWEALTGEEEDEIAVAGVGLRALAATGLSVSLDELALGFTLGILGGAFALTLVYIGLQALLVTFAGLALGARLGRRLEGRAELASGLLLAGLGLTILAARVSGHPIIA